MKIKAFILRRKTSKQGKVYYVAPYGNCDLLGFEMNEAGDIEVSYCEREQKPATAAYTKPQAPVRATITPRSQPPKIVPRDTPHHRPPPPQDYVDHTAKPYDESVPWPDDSELPF